MDEKILIKQSINGDVTSFEQLIKSYQKMAYNVAYRVMGNEEDAKDMTQEALIKVYKNLKSFRMDASFSTWLYRIVMNTCKDALRKNKTKVISLDQPLDTGDGEMQWEIEDEGLKPDEQLVQKETQNEVQKALQLVGENNRIVLVLRDIKGLSYSEISDIIDVPEGTVKSRLNRGRQELKEILLKQRTSQLKAIRKEG
ncbi:MAG: sigma-70 family RNA polymerase sigma factor [Clostridia bacterium]|nr:sigma-70 family RNA polymerase sigma factor [Clostridia bacterium]